MQNPLKSTLLAGLPKVIIWQLKGTVMQLQKGIPNLSLIIEYTLSPSKHNTNEY